jgi:hypothetical protein
MTVAELKAEAERRGIKVPSRAKKADLEKLLGFGTVQSVKAGVENDLAAIAKRWPGVWRTALAAQAVELAKQLDSPENSATSKSMCARSLTETMDRINELAPEERKGDRLDDIKGKRARKS